MDIKNKTVKPDTWGKHAYGIEISEVHVEDNSIIKILTPEDSIESIEIEDTDTFTELTITIGKENKDALEKAKRSGYSSYQRKTIIKL